MSGLGETITIVFVPPEQLRPHPDQLSAAHRYTTSCCWRQQADQRLETMGINPWNV